MTDHSRRLFLAATGAGGVAAGAALLGAGTTSLLAGGSADEDASFSDGPIVAYVRDLSKGEITVMRGDHETVLHDRALARTLAGLAG